MKCVKDGAWVTPAEFLKDAESKLAKLISTHTVQRNLLFSEINCCRTHLEFHESAKNPQMANEFRKKLNDAEQALNEFNTQASEELLIFQTKKNQEEHLSTVDKVKAPLVTSGSMHAHYN